MREIEYRSHSVVVLENVLGDEQTICDTARVSTDTHGSQKANQGLLNMLMRDRHGSPWESVVLRYYIETPIFVAREFFRHRIASYNEVSGRYTELAPVFYLPEEERPIVQTGKPGAYTFTQGTTGQQGTVDFAHREATRVAWSYYESMIESGVAKEVARNVLPLSLYTKFFVTMNLRSLMNFLSLRHVNSNTTVPTFPLWEIDKVAGNMENLATAALPVALKLFNEHGRVSP